MSERAPAPQGSEKNIKSNQEIANQVGRITSKLVERAKSLDGMQVEQTSIGKHLDTPNITKGEVAGGASIEVADHSMAKNITVRRGDADGAPVTHEANVTHAWSASPDRTTHYAATETQNRDEGYRVSTQRVARPGDFGRAPKSDLLTASVTTADSYESQGHDRNDSAAETAQMAVTNAAETLGAIRGTIAAAEKQQAAQVPAQEQQPPKAA